MEIKHVAIIMDGNGRWAKRRNHSRSWGHMRGCRHLLSITRQAQALQIEELTLFALSTENWSRPDQEISTLLKIMEKFLTKHAPDLIQQKIALKIIGRREDIPSSLLTKITNIERETARFPFKLNIAFSYGGKFDIMQAVQSLLKKGMDICEDNIEKELLAPPVDLLIRTGNEFRISNFLLWQIAYAELYFSPLLWPEFDAAELDKIVQETATRERRFGKIH